MPYLLQLQEKQLLLLNDTAKNGLYYQILSSNGMSRPFIIHRSNTSEYSATIDSEGCLHIITKPSADQVIYLQYKDNNVTREVLLEDPKNIYNFSNLKITYTKKCAHVFYTANKPIGNTCQLIHHILCHENKIETNPIISFSSTPLGFRYIVTNDIIHVLYGELKDHYTLQLLTYKDDTWSSPSAVALSSFPIDDFQFCIDTDENIHLIYVQEKYGRYHLLYKKFSNHTWSEEIVLYTTSSKISPVIFTYYRGIWINFLDNASLQMILSMDKGNTFSSSVTCSLQGAEMQYFHFVPHPSTLSRDFNCNAVYAISSPSIRIGIIAYIDMLGIHPDISTNTELELLLDGVFHTLSITRHSPNQLDDIDAIRTENEELKLVQEQMVQQYNQVTELTKRIQEEGKKWRNKALTLETQLKNYENKE